MKKLSIAALVLLALAVLGSAALSAENMDDIEAHRSCTQCGMDRKSYGYSRMLLRFADGGQIGVCSLNCAVIELNNNKGREVQALLVADRDSHVLLAAGKAFWVMGGSKRGVMTRRPKWAFATEAAARAFIRDHGGTMVTWDEVLKSARQDAGVL